MMVQVVVVVVVVVCCWWWCGLGVVMVGGVGWVGCRWGVGGVLVGCRWAVVTAAETNRVQLQVVSSKQ